MNGSLIARIENDHKRAFDVFTAIWTKSGQLAIALCDGGSVLPSLSSCDDGVDIVIKFGERQTLISVGYDQDGRLMVAVSILSKKENSTIRHLQKHYLYEETPIDFLREEIFKSS